MYPAKSQGYSMWCSSHDKSDISDTYLGKVIHRSDHTCVDKLCDLYHKNSFPTRPKNGSICQWSMVVLRHKINKERWSK
jgi:hypothetical protein